MRSARGPLKLTRRAAGLIAAAQMSARGQAVCAAARRLGRALIASSKPSRAWSPALETTALHLLSSSSPSPTPLTPSLVAATIDPHLLAHAPLALGLFHWASHQPGFAQTPLTYHALLKSLSVRRPRRVLSLLRLARAHRVPLLSSSLRLALPALLLSHHSLEAAELLEHTGLLDGGGGVPPTLVNSLLAALSSDGFFDAAKKTFEKMLQRGIEFHDIGFGVFISRLCRVVELNEVLDLVEEVKRCPCRIHGSVVVVLIVDGLCQAGKIEQAWQALEELRRREWKPDFIAYRIVSEALKLAGRLEEAGRILKQKRKLGVAPRVNDYREFIFSLISERQICEAKKLGQAIVGGDFPIEDDVLNLLIGSVSTVDPDAAVMFSKYMIGRERFPSLAMLSNLSRSLCKNGKTDEMWDVFRDLLAKGYFKRLEDYNVMVSFLCKAGLVREAYDMLKEMRKKGFSPDICSYNYVMEACCRGDLMQPAKRLWDEMFANGCCPNLQTYNILIQKFSETGEVVEAEQLFCHMLEKGMVPDDMTFASVIKVLCREKRLDAALEVLLKSMKQDVLLAGSTLSTLILSLCKDGNFVAATSVLHGLPLNVGNSEAHVVLLKSLADAREVEMALDHVEWIRNNRSLKLQVILSELMASLSTAPKLDHVLQLLRAMHARGLMPDDSSWLDLYGILL